MKKKHLYMLGCTAAAIVIIVSTCLYTALSTWFYWGLLPETGKIALSIEAGNHLEPFIALADSTVLPANHLAVYTGVASRLAYTDKGNGHLLIILPKVLSYRQAKASLVQEGWHYQKFGIILIAEKGGNSGNLAAKTQLSSIIRALMMPWQQFLLHGQAFHPPAVLVAKPAVYVGLENGLTATSQYQEGGVYAKATLKYSTPSSFSEVGHVEKSIADNNTEYNLLALQRKMLAYIPTTHKDTILHNTVSQVGFSKTVDPLVKHIAAMPTLTLYQEGEHASLGSQENTEAFIKTARTWVEGEEAYNYPQRRAFKLPDGTLGYEMRPSKPNSKWVNTDNNCQYLKGRAKTWWICSSHEQAVISNSQATATQALIYQKNGYQQLHLAQLKDKQAQSNNIEVIDIIGKDDTIEIFIK